MEDHRPRPEDSLARHDVRRVGWLSVFYGQPVAPAGAISRGAGSPREALHAVPNQNRRRPRAAEVTPRRPGCLGLKEDGRCPSIVTRTYGVVQAKVSGWVLYRVAPAGISTHFCALRVQKWTVGVS